MKQLTTRRFLALAVGLGLPLCVATLHTQQTTSVTQTTTQTGIDPNTGQPYTAQHTYQDKTATTYDGRVQHNATKTENNTMVANPDGTQTDRSNKHSRSQTTAVNPDGSTTVTDSTTTKSNTQTVPQH